MKKWLFILFSAFSFQPLAFSQGKAILFFQQSNSTTGIPVFPMGTNYRGVWGFGQNPGSYKPDWKGYHLTVLWSDVELTEGVYTWGPTDANINNILNSGRYVSLQFQVGPDCPPFLMNSSHADQYLTSGGTIPGPYPRYYSSIYKAAYYKFLKKIAEHLVAFPDVVFWQISEGTTGDEGPHKGNPTGTCPSGPCASDPLVPNGADNAWNNFRKQAWDSAYKYVSGTGNANLHIMMNAGNDGGNVDYIHDNLPTAYIKTGRISHDYMFDGQAMYLQWPTMFSRGEVQGSIFSSPKPKQDAMALVVSAVGLGLGVLNTAPGWYTQMVGSDRRPDQFFNRYANDTIAYTSDHAFINLAMPISMDSSVWWTAGAPGNYGAVIQAGQLTAYNNQITSINNSSTGPASKIFEKVQIIAKVDGAGNWVYFNPTRETNIRAANASNGAAFHWLKDDNNLDDYGNDYIFSGTINYNKWITETNPHANTIPLYKVQPDTSVYGRFAGQFNIISGAAEMPFDIDNSWSGSPATANIQFDITYKNAGTGSWSLYANTGSGMQQVAGPFVNTNENLWRKKVFTVNNMVLGSNTDFKLHYNSGANTIFTLIELLNVSP